MKYRWSMAPAQPALTAFLSREVGVSELLAQCLLNRGLSEPEPIARFLEPRLRQLADPFLIPDMAVAVERLLAARSRGERVVIFGDYDVDGVTSTALLLGVLGPLGWQVASYLPHRRDEGYGLTEAGVDNCLEQHPCALLLAVDCGSTAVATIDRVRGRGVDVVVVDHHQVSDPPPRAVALVNPHRSVSGAGAGGAPAFRELCSAGLAFKLAHALVKRGRDLGLPGFEDFDLRPLLDLVALGTIADLVPLHGENRILVAAGLERLRTTRRPGLVALKEAAGIGTKLGGYEVGYQLAPRLNAAGRLETAEEALRLMLAPDLESAAPMARRLDASNRERQAIERAMAEEAIAAIRARFSPDTDTVIVEGRADWHIGVVGIVASRVLHEFYRPTLILGGDGASWRGSGRSIEGFDLAAALRQCDDLLIRHGGHAMAAGVTVDPARVDDLRGRLADLARRTLKPEQFQPSLRLDAEVPLGALTLERVQELARLEQTGMGNPAVHVVIRGVTHARPLQRMGSEKKHAKLWVTDGRATCEAVLWGVGDGALPVGRFDLAAAPQLNEFNGRVSVQLKVLDWEAV